MDNKQKNLKLLKSLGELGWFDDSASEPEALISYGEHLVLPRGIVGCLVGDSGVGKTTWLMQWMVSLVIDRCLCELFGVNAEGGVALFGATENEAQLRHRLCALLDEFEVTEKQKLEISKLLFFGGFVGQNVALLEDGQPSAFFGQLYQCLEDRAPEQGWSLIVIDPASRFMSMVDENDNTQATMFIRQLEQFTALPGNPTVLFTHYPSKINRQYGHPLLLRGASALGDEVRWQGCLVHDRDEQDDVMEDYVVFYVAKSNYSSRIPPIHLKRTNAGNLKSYDNFFPSDMWGSK